MFDTSVVRARAIAAPRGATLVVSIAIHSIAVVAAVALTLTSTQIPTDPPKQMAVFRPVALPPPPPPLGVRPLAAAVQGGARAPHSIAAPTVIPEQIPVATSTASLAPAGATAGPIGEPDGVPDGVPNGVPDGQPGGTGVVEQHGPYVPGVAGVTSPRVVTKINPQFPDHFRGAVRQTIVVVRCVIGTDGRIHDPEIVKSSFAPFNNAVLDALRHWTFEPGTMNGQPVDTYFLLTVNFEVK